MLFVKRRRHLLHTASKLAHGTKINCYETEETHPDGTKVITTTKVKTYTKLRVEPDGTHIRENVPSTTTITRECVKVERGSSGAAAAVAGTGTTAAGAAAGRGDCHHAG